MTVFADEKQ